VKFPSTTSIGALIVKEHTTTSDDEIFVNDESSDEVFEHKPTKLQQSQLIQANTNMQEAQAQRRSKRIFNQSKRALMMQQSHLNSNIKPSNRKRINHSLSSNSMLNSIRLSNPAAKSNHQNDSNSKPLIADQIVPFELQKYQRQQRNNKFQSTQK
jgi:hypothetical protein